MLVNIGEYTNRRVRASIGSSPICDAKSEPKDVLYTEVVVHPSTGLQIRHFVLSSFERDANCQLGEDTRYRHEERIAGKNKIVEVY